jgi:hypothetical protein
VRVQRCTDRLSNSVPSRVPQGPPSFAVDMSAPYSASASRSPTGLPPEHVLQARPAIVGPSYSAGSRRSRLRPALTRTQASHSDLAPGPCGNTPPEWAIASESSASSGESRRFPPGLVRVLTARIISFAKLHESSPSTTRLVLCLSPSRPSSRSPWRRRSSPPPPSPSSCAVHNRASYSVQ